MRRPLMPWQAYTAQVASERLANGEYAYQVVVVTVPRQSGKTTLVGAVGTERCISEDGHQWFYTAQRGKDARERWNDLVKLVNASALRSMVKVRRSAGSERLVFPNLSELRVFAPTAESLHGYTPPSVCLDEAMAYDEALGDALMGAIGPAQITLPNRQLWIISTAGTAESVFLQRWVEAGRAGADRVALFDWGAADGVDCYDPAELVRFHPALGLPEGNGITVDAILAEAARLPRSEFERAYGNRTIRTAAHTIPPEEWAKLAAAQVPPTSGIVLSYDVAHDRTAATILAGWRDDAGRAQVKVVKSAPGTDWVADDVGDYARRWSVRTVVATDDGPAREVTDRLRNAAAGSVPAAARNVVTLTARDVTVAWGQLLTGVRTRGFGHDGSPKLADAAASVVPRPVLDASAPSRRYSPGDIAPLVAAMAALWQLARQDTGPQLVVTRFG